MLRLGPESQRKRFRLGNPGEHWRRGQPRPSQPNSRRLGGQAAMIAKAPVDREWVTVSEVLDDHEAHANRPWVSDRGKVPPQFGHSADARARSTAHSRASRARRPFGSSRDIQRCPT